MAIVEPERHPGHLASAIGGLAAIFRRRLSERLSHEQWVIDAGLRPHCYGVMIWIDRLEPASQKQISDQIGLDPSDMVAVVDILEHAGFAARQRDPEDRRRSSLTMTPGGRRALRRLNSISAEVQDEILAPLGARDRATFERLVQRVVEHHMSPV